MRGLIGAGSTGGMDVVVEDQVTLGSVTVSDRAGGAGVDLLVVVEERAVGTGVFSCVSSPTI